MSDTAVNWPRAVGAVVVGEIVPILLLVSFVALWGPSDVSEADLFARRAGAWIGPIAGAATVLLVAWWAGSRSSRPVLQGAGIGLALALIDFAILVSAGEPLVGLFVVSNGGKVLAGMLGGWLAARGRQRPSAA